ncbi:polyprenyl synthetase family protein [Pseudomonas kitaguniensis]|uniref:polyprenyl synthetase family protein n=1 Tax=Pseudomonas kitaguniensis TaxID=2607908 RepID=UPI003D08B42D
MGIPVMNPLSKQYASAKTSWSCAFEYQEQHAGKNVRTELALALAALYGIDTPGIEVVCQVVEKFNTASLVHDDIVDQDPIRRGAPAVWVKYGTGTALLSGMYGYIEGLQQLAKLNDPGLLDTGIKSLETLHIGQYLDAQLSEGQVLPTLEEYRFIAQTNTGCFFLFILDACQQIKPAPRPVHELLTALMLELSVYYRYINDYCDINHIPHFKKKGFAPDLEGGPKSFIMILADCACLKQKRTDAQKRQTIMAFGEAGVFSEALRVMDDSYLQLQRCLAKIRTLSQASPFQPLAKFFDDLKFQQAAHDNYYQCLITDNLPPSPATSG